MIKQLIRRIADTRSSDGKENNEGAQPEGGASLVVDGDDEPEPPTPSPVLREVGDMIKFALENPESSQVPLECRDEITQSEWESMDEAGRARIRDSLEGVCVTSD